VQLQCNRVLIIYAQYWYWYWYLKVTYWYLYWYLVHWYWYWYLFVEYLIQDWHMMRFLSTRNSLTVPVGCVISEIFLI